jgi:hypothetical protein
MTQISAIKSSPHKNSFSDEDFRGNQRDSAVVVDDPTTRVDGRTIAQWIEEFYRLAVPSAGGTPNAFYDPSGSVAAQLNNSCGPMYFITLQAGPDPSPVRTFNIHYGEAVLVPIVGVADSEGPGINPTRSDFNGTPAELVEAVLADAHFTNGSYQLDGGKTVTDLPVIDTGVFNAGYAPPGSAGANFFAAPNGAELKATGSKGYSVILDHLSRGQHVFTGSGTLTSPDYTGGMTVTQTVTDIINVV